MTASKGYILSTGPGSAGQVLTSQGAGTPPAWATASSGPDGGQRVAALGRYDFPATVEPSTPSVPAPPTFSGALITCGTGGTYATLSAAVAAATAGDRIQVLPGTITESATVAVTKSLEIFGTGNSCIVQRDSTTGVITVSVANVYIHDFCVVNNTLASADVGGQSACINADTMNRYAYSGVSGTYIASMLFQQAKVGVFISGTSWVMRDCAFQPSAANTTAGTTLRCVYMYGSEGTSFIKSNTFQTTTDNARVTGIYFVTRNDGIPPNWESGYKGTLVTDGNSFINGGGAPRSYVDATSMFHQSGPAATDAPNGQFDWYLVNNNFSLQHQSSPVVIFGRAGATAPLPLSFFGTLQIKGNSFGDRGGGSTNQKGGVFFTSAVALASTSLGTVQTGFWASSNTVTPQTLPAANVSIMADSSLLMVRDSTYYVAPSPLLASLVPVYVPSGAVTTADGVSLTVGSRAWLISSAPLYSGIYDVNAGVWTRSSDYADGLSVNATYFWVKSGSIYGNTMWECNNAVGSDVVGTDALTWQAVLTRAFFGAFYAAIHDTATQPMVDPTQSQIVTFSTLDEAAGVTLVANNSIKVPVAGVYNFQFSFQLLNIDNSADHDARIWLTKNGGAPANNIPYTSSVAQVPRQQGTTPGAYIMAFNFVLTLAANDYLQVWWNATDAQVSIQTVAATPGSPTVPQMPASPGAICTVTQVR